MNPDSAQHRGEGRSAFRLAGRFLLPADPEVAGDDAGWRRAALWLPVWGLLIGAAYAGVFRVLWLWLGEYQHIRVAPMALLLVFDAGLLGYRLLAGAAGVVGSWSGRPGSSIGQPPIAVMVFLILAMVVKFALLVALPSGAVTWPADWRQHLRVVYPYVLYRPLVLMPLWGRWAVMLATNIGRASPESSGRLRAMASGSRLSRIIAFWAGIAGLTILYCSPSSHHVGWSLLISLAMLVVAYLVAFVLARRCDGQTEMTVTATGWAVEMAFLLVYLPVARYIYWY